MSGMWSIIESTETMQYKWLKLFSRRYHFNLHRGPQPNQEVSLISLSLCVPVCGVCPTLDLLALLQS